MPQNTKDSNGGKNKPVKNTATKGGKRTDTAATERKSVSPAGAQNKGEKKTTP